MVDFLPFFSASFAAVRCFSNFWSHFLSFLHSCSYELRFFNLQYIAIFFMYVATLRTPYFILGFSKKTTELPPFLIAVDLYSEVRENWRVSALQ